MQQQPQGAPVAAPKVHNGTYTVEHPEKGHFTLKLYTVRNGDLAGRRMIAILTGPDNESNFTPVAFWDDEVLRASVFKRHRCPRNVGKHTIDGYNWGDDWSRTEKKIAIWLDLVTRGFELTEEGPRRKTAEGGLAVGYWSQAGYSLLLEGRCCICDRKLTDPLSIKLGIGPTCGGRS